MNKQARITRIFLLLMLLCLLVAYASSRISKVEKTYKQFQKDVEDGAVTEVSIEQNPEVPTGVLHILTNTKNIYTVNISDVLKAEEYLNSKNVSYSLKQVKSGISAFTVVMLCITAVFAIVLIYAMISGRAGGASANNKMLNFGKSSAKLSDSSKNKVTFSSVAGLKEEKEELEEIVSFLKNPTAYTALGARIPKGVLLVGPPGTGKTLLAKAVAGEAQVPFFSISGSDFVEMFVGVGASRVRDLFNQAKANSPCIVFIDEIDAVARRRGTGLGGGHDEREQTLNQMLVEMDGFGVNSGIIVMAATNRVDILDPAILRPGRFDRKIAVGVPDVRGRLEILQVHSKNKPLSDDVDLERIAQTTAGFTGADLENLMNESAILAASEKKAYISQSDIDRSFIKVGIGGEKRSKVISEKEKLITAYHEAGHAILFHVLPDVGPVHTISIIPTGMGAAGYTMPLPEKDEMFMTKGKILQNIEVSLGGRIAEQLVFDDITTGASQDIKEATHLARSMVTKYGMSKELGFINYDSDEDEVFIGRDLAHAKPYSEAVAGKIDSEVKDIIDYCYEKAKAIIEEYKDVLERCAKLLVEKEKLMTGEFESLFDDTRVERSSHAASELAGGGKTLRPAHT